MPLSTMKKPYPYDRKLGLEEKIANGLNNIGNIHKYREQYITAIKYYEESLEMYRKLWKEDSILFRRRLNTISDICKSTGQYEKAFKYYKEALDVYTKIWVWVIGRCCLSQQYWVVCANLKDNMKRPSSILKMLWV